MMLQCASCMIGHTRLRLRTDRTDGAKQEGGKTRAGLPHEICDLFPSFLLPTGRCALVALTSPIFTADISIQHEANRLRCRGATFRCYEELYIVLRASYKSQSLMRAAIGKMARWRASLAALRQGLRRCLCICNILYFVPTYWGAGDLGREYFEYY